MNFFSPVSPGFLIAAIAAIGVILGGPCVAQSDNSTPSPGSQVPPIQFQVLRTTRIPVGSHSVIYNLVAPPALPASTVAPVSAPAAPFASGPSSAVPGKAFQTIFFSATVYDHQITDLRWFAGTQSFRALSNVDFNYFTGFAQFETSSTVYSYFMLLDNETTSSADAATRALLAQARRQLPNLSLSASTPSSYVVVGGAPPGDSGACSPLDAMQAYYDANRDGLVLDYQARAADEAAAAQALRNRLPAAQADTVVNFWRINSPSAKAGN